MTAVLEIPRESAEWAEVSVTSTAGVPVDATAVELALLPKGTRPGNGDWTVPVLDPEGSGVYGLDLTPSSAGWFGVWVAISTTGGRKAVLEPEDVGYILRT